MSTSKTGKHGHAKVHLIAIDIFTGKKLEDLCPSSHNMNVPHVKRQEYTLLDITDDGFASLMLDDGSTKDDLAVPENDLGQSIRDAFEKDAGEVVIAVQSAMGEEAIVAVKEIRDK